MKINNIPIPGNETTRYSGPWIEIQGEKDQSIILIIKYQKYQEYPNDWTKLHCSLIFTGVLEYKFVQFEFGYNDFRELRDHYDPSVNYLGLLEIHGSPYVENMLANERVRLRFVRGGGNIPEEDLKHYRIGFDEYGHFDILAFGVTVTVQEESLAHLRPDITDNHP